MASVYIGGLYGYANNNTSYGYYNLYFDYDSVSRSGTTITYNNARVAGYQSGSGYTTNTVYLDTTKVGGTDVGISWSGKGSSYKEWSAGWKNVSISGVAGSTSQLYVQWWGHRTGQSGSAQSNGANASCPTAYAPSVSALSKSELGTTSVKLSFSCTNNNGQSVTGQGIQVSESNFGTVVKSSTAYTATITGLTPNKTYYARGYCTNAMGTTYTAVISFTTSFTAPGNPGQPKLTYNETEPIPKAKLTATWTAASAGSTAIAGYRVRLYKNNTEIKLIDTNTTSTSYTFDSFESLGFAPGDVAKVGIFAYCKDWAGNWHWSGGGSTQVFSSNTITVVSDKYIYVSQNGGAFNKYKMYISQNGGTFKEVKKEKFKVIK